MAAQGNAAPRPAVPSSQTTAAAETQPRVNPPSTANEVPGTRPQVEAPAAAKDASQSTSQPRENPNAATAKGKPDLIPPPKQDAPAIAQQPRVDAPQSRTVPSAGPELKPIQENAPPSQNSARADTQTSVPKRDNVSTAAKPPGPPAQSSAETQTALPKANETLSAAKQPEGPSSVAEAPRRFDPEAATARIDSPNQPKTLPADQPGDVPAVRNATPDYPVTAKLEKPDLPGPPQRDAQRFDKARVTGDQRQADIMDAIAREADVARVERQASNTAAAVAQPKTPPQDLATRQQAIENSGMASRHAEATSNVAQNRDEFILMGATNKAATAPNDLGYLSKDMHVKGKSASGGADGKPTFYDGMIPVNQGLSKAGLAPSAPDLVNYGGKKGVIDHFNHKVQETLDMPPYKMEFTRADGSKAEAMVSYQKMEITGPTGQKVEVLGKKMEFLGTNGKPNGTVIEGPIVADYDMITIGTKSPAMTQLPDPHLGNVNQQARNTIQDVNVGMGRPLNPGVHHGAQGAAPINPGIPYPVTAFGPDGHVVSIPKASGGDVDLNLKSFYDRMEAGSYHAEVNRDWGWQRGTDGKWGSGETIAPLALSGPETRGPQGAGIPVVAKPIPTPTPPTRKK